jgi:hypothetical protein
MADYSDAYRHAPVASQRNGPVVVEDLIEGLNEWRNIQVRAQCNLCRLLWR